MLVLSSHGAGLMVIRGQIYIYIAESIKYVHGESYAVIEENIARNGNILLFISDLQVES